MAEPLFQGKNASDESPLLEVAAQAGLQFLALRNDDRFIGGIGVQVLGQLSIIPVKDGLSEMALESELKDAHWLAARLSAKGTRM
jgi:hypothetical protein